MRVRPEQLDEQLKQRIAPVYLVFGDEPLLVMEAADTIRARAREQGYDERQVLTVEAGFDWNSLLLNANSGSLFASRRILDLRLGEQKPGDAGSKTLRAYAQRPNIDVVLLISAGRLDQNTQKTRWFSDLDRAGVVVQLWPVDARQLPAWCENRLHAKGMRASPDGIRFLARYVEGNLLAAAQEIDKLYMLHGAVTLSDKQLEAAVEDSARYSIYDLADAALAGRADRCLRIIGGLRNEGNEPVLVLWALTREVRALAKMRFALDKGLSLGAVLSQNKVWEKRKPLVTRALQRLNDTLCRRLISDCARIDKVLKGIEPGNAWDDLLTLSLRISGIKAL